MSKDVVRNDDLVTHAALTTGVHGIDPLVALLGLPFIERDRGGKFGGGASGTRVFAPDLAVAASIGTAAQAIFLFDPTPYAISGKTLKLQVRAIVSTNDTSPAITFTYGLYPVSATSGASGNVAVTLGAVVAGSTVGLTPGANAAALDGVSSVFTAPAKGAYALGVANSGTSTAGADTVHRVLLLRSYV